MKEFELLRRNFSDTGNFGELQRRTVGEVHEEPSAMSG